MRAKDWLVNAAVVVTSLCTVLVTGIVVHRQFFASPTTTPKPIKIDAREWSAISSTGMRIGSADAPLTVVEFVDFECPACAAFYRTLKRFQAAHPKDVAVVLQHYPLDVHPNAVRLARTVDCAAQHGRLEVIQDSIFTRQPAMIGLTPLQFASMVGIADTADFARCISDSTRTRRVDEGRGAARRLNIIGTPTIIANGKQYRQLVDSVVLRKALEDSRRGK